MIDVKNTSLGNKMERKQLVERLELMKKELAQKQKKFEKAKRAARARAHVKQKLLELNHQVKGYEGDGAGSSSTETTSSHKQDKQQTPGHTDCQAEEATATANSSSVHRPGVLEGNQTSRSDSEHRTKELTTLSNSFHRPVVIEDATASANNSSVHRPAASKQRLTLQHSGHHIQEVTALSKTASVHRPGVLEGNQSSRSDSEHQTKELTTLSNSLHRPVVIEDTQPPQLTNLHTEVDGSCSVGWVQRENQHDLHTASEVLRLETGLRGGTVTSSSVGEFEKAKDETDCQVDQDDEVSGSQSCAQHGNSEIDDSMAITPSFKSMGCSGIPSYSQITPSAIENIAGLDAYENTFTLNLHTEASLFQDSSKKLDHGFENSKHLSEIRPADLESDTTFQIKKANQALAVEKTNVAFESKSCSVEFAAEPTEQIIAVAEEDTCATERPEPVAELLATAVSTARRDNKAVACTLKLQDIGSEEDLGHSNSDSEKLTNVVSTKSVPVKEMGIADNVKIKVTDSSGSAKCKSLGATESVNFQVDDIDSTDSMTLPETGNTKHQSLSSQTQSHVPGCQDSQFLDYTELDVIPFSQFELMEDFLSEVSQDTATGSQRTGRRKSMSALVQRRSPRLSMFDFSSGDQSTWEDKSVQRRVSQQSNLFRMAKKKKTKNALLVSSAFQFLIDEAKRDATFEEFKLPEGIEKPVSQSVSQPHSITAQVEKKHPAQSHFKTTQRKHKPSAHSSRLPYEHCELSSQDIEIIPETEVDPDFVSQRFCNADLDMNSTENQLTEKQTESEEEVYGDDGPASAVRNPMDRKPKCVDSLLQLNAKHTGVDSTLKYSVASKSENKSASSDSQSREKGSYNNSDHSETTISVSQIHSRKETAAKRKSLQLKGKQKNKQAVETLSNTSDKSTHKHQGDTEDPTSLRESPKHNTSDKSRHKQRGYKADQTSLRESPKHDTAGVLLLDPARSSYEENPISIKLPRTPETSPSARNLEPAFPSPVLFGTQSQSSKKSVSSEQPSDHKHCSDENNSPVLIDDTQRAVKDKHSPELKHSRDDRKPCVDNDKRGSFDLTNSKGTTNTEVFRQSNRQSSESKRCDNNHQPILTGENLYSDKLAMRDKQATDLKHKRGDENPVVTDLEPETDSGMERGKPVFTPSKSKPGDHGGIAGRCSWITYAGCAESGCKDAVVTTVVGTASTDGEETAFILSVQTTSLTLWTLDDQQAWSAEFHWYLPQTSQAEGASRIHTPAEQLAVLVWGTGALSASPFLTVFDYHWDTQHTQRFNLPLPSSVIPLRMFCHGLTSCPDTVLVFATDKAYTRGRKYVIDRHQGSVSSELAMEETNARLLDLRLVEGLPDAAVGLAVDQKILVWNHKRGALIFSVVLLDTVVRVFRMFSCHFLKGYFLLHTADADPGEDVCLVAINPTAATNKVVRRFAAVSGLPSIWNRAVVHKDILMSVCDEGRLDIWDACSALPLVSLGNQRGKICTADLFNTRSSSWLVTGQETGCLHVYSVTP